MLFLVKQTVASLCDKHLPNQRAITLQANWVIQVGNCTVSRLTYTVNEGRVNERQYQFDDRICQVTVYDMDGRTDEVPEGEISELELTGEVYRIQLTSVLLEELEREHIIQRV